MKIAAAGSPRQLTASGTRKTRISVSTEKGCLLAAGAELPAAVARGTDDAYTFYLSENPGRAVSAILERIEKAGDALVDLRVERPSLEERFLEITGETT